MSRRNKISVLIGLEGILCEVADEKNIKTAKISKDAKDFIIRLCQCGNFETVLHTKYKTEDIYDWLKTNGLNIYIDRIINTIEDTDIYVAKQTLTFCGDFDKMYRRIRNFELVKELS